MSYGEIIKMENEILEIIETGVMTKSTKGGELWI